MINMNFPTLKEDEIPVMCGCVTRHHINALPPELINKLKAFNYELHKNVYYYVSNDKFQQYIKECIEESHHA